MAVFEHVPAVMEDAEAFFKSQRGVEENTNPLGIEFEVRYGCI